MQSMPDFNIVCMVIKLIGLLNTAHANLVTCYEFEIEVLIFIKWFKSKVISDKALSTLLNQLKKEKDDDDMDDDDMSQMINDFPFVSLFGRPSFMRPRSEQSQFKPKLSLYNLQEQQKEESHRQVLEYFAKLTGFESFNSILEIFCTKIFLNIIQAHNSRQPDQTRLIIDQSLDTMQKYTQQ